MKHITVTSKVRQAVEMDIEALIEKVLCMVDPEAEKCTPA
jgi:hypothetical protein